MNTVQKDWDALSQFTDEAKIEWLLATALRLEGDLNAAIQGDPLPNPSADEEVETPSGQKLFRQWCGNSYEWDALTDLERQRWNRLSQQHNAEREAMDGQIIVLNAECFALKENLDDRRARVERLESELATAQKTIEELSGESMDRLSVSRETERKTDE